MTKWKLAWKSDHPIYRGLSDGTKGFLNDHGEDVLGWFDSSRRLIDQFKSDNSHDDYSFLVTPAFKGLEKWLLLIAPHLGVSEETVVAARDHGRLKPFFNEPAQQQFRDEIVDKLKKTAEEKQDIVDMVQSLYQTLKTFRHSPAHCGTVIEDPFMAERDFFTLLNIIDRVTQTLIDDGIIPNGGLKISDPKELERIMERRRIAGLSSNQ